MYTCIHKYIYSCIPKYMYIENEYVYRHAHVYGWDVRVVHTCTRVTKNRLCATHQVTWSSLGLLQPSVSSLSLLPSRVSQSWKKRSVEDLEKDMNRFQKSFRRSPVSDVEIISWKLSVEKNHDLIGPKREPWSHWVKLDNLLQLLDGLTSSGRKGPIRDNGLWSFCVWDRLGRIFILRSHTDTSCVCVFITTQELMWTNLVGYSTQRAPVFLYSPQLSLYPESWRTTVLDFSQFLYQWSKNWEKVDNRNRIPKSEGDTFSTIWYNKIKGTRNPRPHIYIYIRVVIWKDSCVEYVQRFQGVIWTPVILIFG